MFKTHVYNYNNNPAIINRSRERRQLKDVDTSGPQPMVYAQPIECC